MNDAVALALRLLFQAGTMFLTRRFAEGVEYLNTNLAIIAKAEAEGRSLTVEEQALITSSFESETQALGNIDTSGRR